MKFEALKNAREAGGLAELDYSNKKNPKCPHCANDYSIEENEAWHLYDEGDHDVECNYCGEEFRVQVFASYTFSTDEQDEDDEE